MSNGLIVKLLKTTLNKRTKTITLTKEHLNKKIKTELIFKSINALKQNSTMRDIENVDWKEFNENYHPTLKPVQLMRYLVKMITPPGGTCLDPFNGSGTTGIACKLEGFLYIGIEMTKAFCDISIKRIANWVDDLESMVKNKKKQDKNKNDSQTDLFS